MKFLGALTLIISIYGGLILFYRLIAPFIIKIIMKFKHRSTNEHIIFVCTRNLIEWLKQINLFKNNHEQIEDNIKQEKITTYIYIILFISMFSSFIMIILFTSLKTETMIKEISDPTWNEYNHHQLLYMNKLKCPCSSMTISYGNFITLSVILHRVCSSDYVSEYWLSILSNISKHFDNNNWRNSAKSQFQLLSNLCQLANKTIIDAMNSFLLNNFITLNVIDEDDFNKQFNASLIEFFHSIINQFSGLIKIVRLIIQVDQPFAPPVPLSLRYSAVNLIANEIISEEDNQTSLNVDFILNELSDTNTSSDKCICATNKYCRKSFDPIEIDKSLYTIPNLFIGCFMIDSLFLSTLECFHLYFDCFIILKRLMKEAYTFRVNKPWNDVRPLIYDSRSTRFPPNTSISFIVENLMIERWNSSVSYRNYYKSCAPKLCTYSIQIHASFTKVLNTIISMISGITIVLKLLTPYLVKFVVSLIRCKFRSQQKPQSKQRQSNLFNIFSRKFFDKLFNILITLFKRLYNILISLNIFSMRDFGMNTNRTTAKYLGQWASRIYIVLFIGLLSIIALYTIIDPQTLIKTFHPSTFNSYNHLKSKYDDKLRCSCSSIASTYKQYTTIKPIFHQVRRVNIFILFISDLSIYHIKDYRRFLSAHLQFLQGLCELSIQSVNISINQFLDSFLLTTELLSEDDLKKRLNFNIEQMKLNPQNKISQILYLIRHINHGNGIISTYGTNSKYIPSSKEYYGWILKAVGIVYDNECSCAMHYNCTSQAKFIQINSTENVSIQGLKIGCTPSESLLVSTLECFFNSSCIKLIQKYINNVDLNNIFTSLSTKNLKQFSINTTVDELINKLFIEDLNVTIDYLSYYHQCAPAFCEYTSIQKLNLLYTLKVLTGFQGGLTIVLRWLIPKLVRIVVKIYEYRKKRQIIIIQPITTNQITSIELNNKIIRNISYQSESILSTIAEIETNNSSIVQYSYKIILKWIFVVVTLIVILIIVPIIFAKSELATETISTSMIFLQV
uniref:Uncharacterized protein n=1 Tax=Adineta vaga TaxID=104782 RepID=B3G4C6_ADIVA|nr:unknown [Adineta vaga]